MLSLLGSHLPAAEQAVAAWFGPKGFASVVYGLIVLDAGLSRSDELFHLIALVIFASILAHSSTDVPIAHAFGRAQARRAGGDAPDTEPSTGAAQVGPPEAGRTG